MTFDVLICKMDTITAPTPGFVLRIHGDKAVMLPEHCVTRLAQLGASPYFSWQQFHLGRWVVLGNVLGAETVGFGSKSYCRKRQCHSLEGCHHSLGGACPSGWEEGLRDAAVAPKNSCAEVTAYPETQCPHQEPEVRALIARPSQL